jgi:hypothetical protein
VSNGEGLLSNNGASICNLVTGDATRAYLTTAAIKDESQGIGESKAFLGFFLSPSGYLRSFTLFIGEFIKERPGGARTGRGSTADAPGLKYAGIRAPTSRDVNVADHRRDVPRQAHHLRQLHRLRRLAAAGPSGVDRSGLDGVDRAIARCQGHRQAPRPTSSRACRTTARAWVRPTSSARREPRPVRVI